MAKATKRATYKIAPRQEAFCQLYATGDKDGQQCAIEAGYSKRSAAVESSRLLNMPKIAKRVEELRAATTTANTLTRQEIREIRAQIAKDSRANRGDRLAALRDESKMMGWDQPETIDVRFSLIDQLRGR